MKAYGAGEGKAAGYNACNCRQCRPRRNPKNTSNVGRRAARFKSAKKTARRWRIEEQDDRQRTN